MIIIKFSDADARATAGGGAGYAKVRDDCGPWKGLLQKKPSKDERSASEGTITTHVEPKQLEERLAIATYVVVYETIGREGEEELHRMTSALQWSPLAAGLSMGFFIAEGFLMAHLPDELLSGGDRRVAHGCRVWNGAGCARFLPAG
ncbi:MAG TPA: hypothetical protein VN833_29670 [Candidatus Acidoferrales bacterium]|nr:hypothetical protein [Candidatus Acidoferrales bacterium]